MLIIAPLAISGWKSNVAILSVSFVPSVQRNQVLLTNHSGMIQKKFLKQSYSVSHLARV